MVWWGAAKCFHIRLRSRKLLYPHPNNFRWLNLCPEGKKRSGTLNWSDIHPL